MSPPSPSKTPVFKLTALRSPLVALRLIAPAFPPVAITGDLNNNCVPMAVPQGAASPERNNSPESKLALSLTVNVQTPAVFSPLNTTKPPSPVGLKVPLKGAEPSAILMSELSSSRVS